TGWPAAVVWADAGNTTARIKKTLIILRLYLPAALSRNLLNRDSSDGMQRSSRIPDHPPTDILSGGIKVQTLILLVHGFVYVIGSVSVMTSRNRFGLGRSQRSSRTAFSLIGKPY